MGKVLRISHKLKFTPSTLGCYGLNYAITRFGFASKTGVDFLKRLFRLYCI